MPTQTSTITGVVQAIVFPPVGTINEGLALLDFTLKARGLFAMAGSNAGIIYHGGASRAICLSHSARLQTEGFSHRPGVGV